MSSRLNDPLMQAIATLPVIVPDDAHTSELRVRCRAVLEHPSPPEPVALERATVCAVCATYAWQIVQIIVR